MSNRKCILSSIVPLKFIYEIFVTNRNVSVRLTLNLPTNFSQSRNKSIKVDESCLLRVKLTEQSLPQKAVKWKILKKCLLINPLSCSSDSTSTKINRTKRNHSIRIYRLICPPNLAKFSSKGGFHPHQNDLLRAELLYSLVLVPPPSWKVDGIFSAR